MWIGNIGNKCASFINHKFFHPGNKRNMERVWLAEEKERKRKEEEENYLKKREEQYRMHCLQRIIKKNENENKSINKKLNYIDPNHPFDDIKKTDTYTNEKNEARKIKKSRRNGTLESEKEEEADKEEESEKNKYMYIKNGTAKKNATVKSKYNEDVYLNNHKSVYGSFYDKDTKSWGFQCCKSTDKDSFCTNNGNGKWNVSHERLKRKEVNNVMKTKKEIKKKKKKKKNKLEVDNSITAVLNMIN